MATGSKPLILRLILTFMFVNGLLNFCYKEDIFLSYGLRSAVRWEARAARQVAEKLKDISQRGTGRDRGSAFLPSRINYTANGNSTFQLHCIINARDVQTNPGPTNSMKQTKYSCKESGKNIDGIKMPCCVPIVIHGCFQVLFVLS